MQAPVRARSHAEAQLGAGVRVVSRQPALSPRHDLTAVDNLQVVVDRLRVGDTVGFLPRLVLGVDLVAAGDWGDLQRGLEVFRRLAALLERHPADERSR